MAPVPQSSEEVTDTTQSCIAESNKDSRSKDKNKWKKVTLKILKIVTKAVPRHNLVYGF